MLKVYGFLGWRNEATPAPNGNRQTREIVAAHSVNEVLSITGKTRADYSHSGGTTANDEEVTLAMSEPGVVFWKPLDARGADAWTRQEPR